MIDTHGGELPRFTGEAKGGGTSGARRLEVLRSTRDRQAHPEGALRTVGTAGRSFERVLATPLCTHTVTIASMEVWWDHTYSSGRWGGRAWQRWVS